MTIYSPFTLFKLSLISRIFGRGDFLPALKCISLQPYRKKIAGYKSNVKNSAGNGNE